MINKKLPDNFKQYINPQFRKQSLEQLKNLRPEHIEIFDYEDLPQNDTAVFRLDKSTIETIKELQTKLRTYSDDQYYYPTDQLHITLIGNLDININPKRITIALKKCLTGYKDLEFVLLGLGSNQYGSSISAYPTFNLAKLRNNLRQEIGSQGDDYSIHLSAYEEVGWINYLRYLNRPDHKFLELLYKQKDTFFGYCKPRSLELYTNSSKVLASDSTSLVWKSDL